jgi:glycosyltransferase involved in cell wall biosynthesis
MTNPGIQISIIIPAYNCSEHLEACLGALKPLCDPTLEIIVVDDASTDDTPLIAARITPLVLRLPKNYGPAAARNYGASHAYPKASGVVSQYRNLLHHFVHQGGHREASTFWAGCGAIRRSVFESVGGFDEKRFPRPSIEDIELGYRLRRAGHSILLEKQIQGTHLKRWTLRSVLRTDIFCRAIPWARLTMESAQSLNDLNLKWSQKLSGSFVLLACLLLMFAVVLPASLIVSAIFIICVIIMNRDLYMFLGRQKGFLFALACIPFHLLYYLYSILSYIYVWMAHRIKIVARA